ncbi:MAG: hypothetical protein J3Q66DRAFT_408130 [Benniella sp.]|nr:MAG: hypothetical protein J3Q66DRAFT_408130 [Benniella sp.]
MSKLLLKVKHGTKRPLPKRPLPLKVDKYRDKHRLGVTTSPRGSNIRKPYHARRQQQYQQETTHPEKIGGLQRKILTFDFSKESVPLSNPVVDYTEHPSQRSPRQLNAMSTRIG